MVGQVNCQLTPVLELFATMLTGKVFLVFMCVDCSHLKIICKVLEDLI